MNHEKMIKMSFNKKIQIGVLEYEEQLIFGQPFKNTNRNRVELGRNIIEWEL
jgi:hypothetical protein